MNMNLDANTERHDSREDDSQAQDWAVLFAGLAC